jgi:hypothetical protein
MAISTPAASDVAWLLRAALGGGLVVVETSVLGDGVTVQRRGHWPSSTVFHRRNKWIPLER